MNIILVHGIWDNGFLFNPLVKYLTREGHKCYAPSLKPADARRGLVDLAKKLKVYIDSSIGKQSNFILIGFSMGSLVSRYYLQELEGYKRVDAFFSISGPHRGTMTAFFYLGKGAKDMRPNSPFLRNLDASVDRLSNLKLYSYRTPLDLMIFPSHSSVWGKAENIKIWSPFHCLMPRNRRLFKDLSRRLEEIAAEKQELENE